MVELRGSGFQARNPELTAYPATVPGAKGQRGAVQTYGCWLQGSWVKLKGLVTGHAAMGAAPHRQARTNPFRDISHAPDLMSQRFLQGKDGEGSRDPRDPATQGAPHTAVSEMRAMRGNGQGTRGARRLEGQGAGERAGLEGRGRGGDRRAPGSTCEVSRQLQLTHLPALNRSHTVSRQGGVGISVLAAAEWGSGWAHPQARGDVEGRASM